MIRQTTLSRVSLPRVAEYDRATAELSRAIRGLRRLGTAMVVLLLALPLVLGVTDAEAAPLLYLTGGTEVVVLDTATDSIVATIPTSPSQGTRGVAVSADAQRLYLTVVDTAQVLEIDTATNQVVDSSVLPNRGGAVAVHPAGSPVYVDVGTNPSEVAVVDFPSDDVTHIALPFASNPADVAVDPRGTFAYATNFQGGSVSVIDTANKSIVTNVPVGSAPTGVSVNRAGTRAYVANPGSGTVSVIDTATNVVVATVPISPPIGGPGAPTSVVVHPLSTFVYAVNTCAVSDCAGSVSVIDAASNTVVHTVPVGFAPRGIAITPDGTRVYVANGCQFDALPCSSGSISVISTATNQVVNTIPVTVTPDQGGNAEIFKLAIVPPNCTQLPDGTPCNDGSACTDADACSGGICVGAPAVCNDDDACTVDTCDPTTGCAFAPLQPSACDDHDVCTVDGCDAIVGCTHEPGNAGVECRASAGQCDVAETCTGASAACPADSFLSSANVCRAGVDECDLVEHCSGTDADCPTDAKKSSGTPCSDDGNPCSLDRCDGTSDICQHPAGNAGATCRPSAGECDLAETCDGASLTCPGNIFRPSSYVCRVAAGECDVAEHCSGADADCPLNGFVTAGIACTDDGQPCTNDACDGAGACTHQALPDSDGDSVCDAADACTNIGGARDFITRPKSKVILSKVNTETTPGNDKLLLSGRFNLPTGVTFTALDPRTRGGRVVVKTVLGADVLDAQLPPGSYGGKGTRGWRTNPKGTFWQYLDKTSTPLSGIVGFKVTDRGKGASGGLVAVTVNGKNGTYPVATGNTPLEAIVVLGNQTDAIAGKCGESAYAASDCSFNPPGSTLKCQR